VIFVSNITGFFRVALLSTLKMVGFTIFQLLVVVFCLFPLFFSFLAAYDNYFYSEQNKGKIYNKQLIKNTLNEEVIL